MGEVIPLFKHLDGLPEDAREPWSLAAVLSEELQDSIKAVEQDMENLWHADSMAEFIDTMAVIKEQVAAWPTGADDG